MSQDLSEDSRLDKVVPLFSTDQYKRWRANQLNAIKRLDHPPPALAPEEDRKPASGFKEIFSGIAGPSAPKDLAELESIVNESSSIVLPETVFFFERLIKEKYKTDVFTREFWVFHVLAYGIGDDPPDRWGRNDLYGGSMVHLSGDFVPLACDSICCTSLRRPMWHETFVRPKVPARAATELRGALWSVAGSGLAMPVFVLEWEWRRAPLHPFETLQEQTALDGGIMTLAAYKINQYLGRSDESFWGTTQAITVIVYADMVHIEAHFAVLLDDRICYFQHPLGEYNVVCSEAEYHAAAEAIGRARAWAHARALERRKDLWFAAFSRGEVRNKEMPPPDEALHIGIIDEEHVRLILDARSDASGQLNGESIDDDDDDAEDCSSELGSYGDRDNGNDNQDDGSKECRDGSEGDREGDGAEQEDSAGSESGDGSLNSDGVPSPTIFPQMPAPWAEQEDSDGSESVPSPTVLPQISAPRIVW